MLSGLFLALHFTTFYGAVKLTSIANATLLGITAPIFTIIYEKFAIKKAHKSPPNPMQLKKEAEELNKKENEENIEYSKSKEIDAE